MSATTFEMPRSPTPVREGLRARWRRLRAPRVETPGEAPEDLPAPEPLAGPGLHVGPAQVLGVDPSGRPLVMLSDDCATRVVAEWALPFRYHPAPGDQLWTIGRRGRHWVIGVLSGRGRTELAFRADTALTARGTLRLQADRGLRLVGRVVTLRARALEVAVTSLEELLGSATRLVSGALEEVAGRVVRITQEEEQVMARDVTIMAEELARLDGDPVQVS